MDIFCRDSRSLVQRRHFGCKLARQYGQTGWPRILSAGRRSGVDSFYFWVLRILSAGRKSGVDSFYFWVLGFFPLNALGSLWFCHQCGKEPERSI